MTTCSDKYPTTDVLYDEISGDPVRIVLLAVAGVLAVITILLYVEIVIYMRKVGYSAYRSHFMQRCLLVGLYPVVCVTSTITLIVPTSTTIINLILACYISLCIYTFVQMTIDYFGGESAMIQTLSENKVILSTPPCCCCCCCILKPVTLSKKSLTVLKICAMQVAFVRPTVLFLAAVLWTDGQYVEKMDFVTSYPYIAIISTISTLVSMYGLVVIYRGSRTHLHENRYIVKFVVLQVAVVLVNLQNTIFNTLAQNNIPGCLGSRGSRPRASSMNHSLLVLESFLLCLLARYGYRQEEPNLDILAKRYSRSPLDTEAKEDEAIKANDVASYGASTNLGFELDNSGQ